MGARNSVMIGAAGEDFVLFQLHVRDLLAAQAPPNAYAADIDQRVAMRAADSPSPSF